MSFQISMYEQLLRQDTFPKLDDFSHIKKKSFCQKKTNKKIGMA